MAGQPKRRAVTQELAKRAREHLGDNATALDYVALETASGKSLAKLAQEFTDTLGVGDIGREFVRRILIDQSSEDTVTETLKVARLTGASSLAEQGQQILDEAVEDRDAIAKAKAQADFRARMAGWWNRQEYGEQRGVAVQVNIETLHIDAMRQHRISNPSQATARLTQGETVQELTPLQESDNTT